jgi:galactose-1-phosphate uridylyltransferase
MIQNVQPHRRLNPLTGQWVLVSPHRTQRPWQGKQEQVSDAGRQSHDPSCYLCAEGECYACPPRKFVTVINAVFHKQTQL